MNRNYPHYARIFFYSFSHYFYDFCKITAAPPAISMASPNLRAWARQNQREQNGSGVSLDHSATFGLEPEADPMTVAKCLQVNLCESALDFVRVLKSSR
jgi:hypothetical protein